MRHSFPASSRRRTAGMSLIEMMVAIAIGLVLITIMSVVYINSKQASRRVDQISGLQQSVRAAFEYIGFDARMVGHLGCFTRHDGLVVQAGATLANNFAIGIEGYEFTGTAPSGTYTLTANLPTDITTATSWTNSSGTTTPSLPLTGIAGASAGLTPGSDVVILRSVGIGKPVRLTAAVAGGTATSIPIENTSTGSCPNGTANVSGFCDGSYGVIASCTAAQAFQVNTAGANLAISTPLQGSQVYAVNATEVFPIQTVAYYVKRSSNGTTTSLYRRVMDGAQNQEQELIEGVENMQVRYAIDTDSEPDGIVNGDFVTANNVGDWSRVLAVRVSLLIRGNTAIEAALAPASGVSNQVRLIYPTTGDRFDRRVFTTTVALRNRISYPMP